MRNPTLFDKCLDNAERLLEIELLGWSFRSIHNVPSPLSLPEVVQATIKNAGLKDTRVTRPEPTGNDKAGRPIYGPEIVLAMRTINPAYGELRRHMAAKWKLFYGSKNESHV